MLSLGQGAVGDTDTADGSGKILAAQVPTSVSGMIILRDHHTCETALAISARRSVLFRHRVQDVGDGCERMLWVAAESDGSAGIRVAVVVDPTDAIALWAAGAADVQGVATRAGVPVLALGGPLLLAPVIIPKPWGREIWFTGSEARGQSEVVGDRGKMPLQWLLSIVPEEVFGAAAEPLNLLKILDPLPDPVYGDLYFELHREKSEVYVVTGVYGDSWPDGQGAIRFGLAPGVRQEYTSEREFRAAYLAHVQSYRQVRRHIDSIQDGWRAREGIGPNEPVPAATLRRWHAALAPELRLLETQARAAMDRYTQLHPLRAGDVVQVPPGAPHALQHGVRTIEFQTPVYERKILSFAQKVLTQDHWDTEEVVADMLIDPPVASTAVVLAETPGLRYERIATFTDFVVERLSLAPGHEWGMETAGAYALAIVVAGAMDIGGHALGSDAAVLVPASCALCCLRNTGGETAVLLISRPWQSGIGMASSRR